MPAEARQWGALPLACQAVGREPGAFPLGIVLPKGNVSHKQIFLLKSRLSSLLQYVVATVASHKTCRKLIPKASAWGT